MSSGFRRADFGTLKEGRMFELNPRYKIKEHNEMLTMMAASVNTSVFMGFSLQLVDVLFHALFFQLKVISPVLFHIS